METQNGNLMSYLTPMRHNRSIENLRKCVLPLHWCSPTSR
jgi:hypothetical protein